MEPFLSISLAFLAGALGGGAVSFGLRWGISRRCLRSEVAILDLQKYLLSIKGQKGAEARWGQRDKDLAALEQYKLTEVAKPRRYDNDPFVSEEMIRGTEPR